MKYGCFRYPIWNGPANSIPILNENCLIHLIQQSLEKDRFSLISYSHIPVKTAELPPGTSVYTLESSLAS